ncbi:hypothetical protein BKD26_01615 [Streptomyces sp. CB03238]|nr:hypothetical protein BKD26_01615 [Streptomyces sp. CB03238]
MEGGAGAPVEEEQSGAGVGLQAAEGEEHRVAGVVAPAQFGGRGDRHEAGVAAPVAGVGAVPRGDRGDEEGVDHGRIRATLTPEGPGEEPEFADPARGPAWVAARDYLHLLRTAPDRIRACAHEACVLHFFDTSRNGTRRWCSMAVCGNRAKASRHYARTKEA